MNKPLMTPKSALLSETVAQRPQAVIDWQVGRGGSHFVVTHPSSWSQQADECIYGQWHTESTTGVLFVFSVMCFDSSGRLRSTETLRRLRSWPVNTVSILTPHSSLFLESFRMKPSDHRKWHDVNPEGFIELLDITQKLCAEILFESNTQHHFHTLQKLKIKNISHFQSKQSHHT